MVSLPWDLRPSLCFHLLGRLSAAEILLTLLRIPLELGGDNPPISAQRMGFGVEYHLIENECLRWGKQQIEILERLGKEEALH